MVALSLGLGLIVIGSGYPTPLVDKRTAGRGLKAPVQGLIVGPDFPPSSHFDAVHAIRVSANWEDLQPELGGPIVEGNVIDQTLQQVRSLNAQRPGRDMTIKLRVYAGIHAPEWAKHLDGPPLEIKNPQNGEGGTVGRFWTETFGRAYAELQAQLAARYDQAPEIRDVVISRCTTVFAEPFIRNTGDRANVTALLDAGFTPKADRRCHHQQIDAHKVWEQTRSSLAFNPYQVVPRDTEGQRTIDEGFAAEMMRYCRSTLGERCILENNSIRWPVLKGYEGLYAGIRELGPPIAFQTAPRSKVGDLESTLAWAVEQGANSVELFRGYQDYPPELLAEFHRELKANPLGG